MKFYVKVIKPFEGEPFNDNTYDTSFDEKKVEQTIFVNSKKELKSIILKYAYAENGYGMYFENSKHKLLSIKDLLKIKIIKSDLFLEETNTQFYIYNI